MQRAERLLTLFHHRWNLPVLAELHRTSGTRFVLLLNRLGISRDSLTHTLAALIHARWVRRNPGYGHPLRPEYILTKSGSRIAPHCQAILDELQRRRVEDVGLRKWSMPVLLEIAGGTEHFAGLKTAFPGITARALSLALGDLLEISLIDRIVVDDYPPTTRYELDPKARPLTRALSGLAGSL